MLRRPGVNTSGALDADAGSFPSASINLHTYIDTISGMAAVPDTVLRTQ